MRDQKPEPRSGYAYRIPAITAILLLAGTSRRTLALQAAERMEASLQHQAITEIQTKRPDLFGFEVNGKIMGLEIFDSHDSLVHYFDKLVQSYALDALDLLMQGQSPPKNRPKVDKWLREVTQLPLIKNPSLGLGEDLRLESQQVIGSGLLHEDTVVYLTVFPKNGAGVKSGMARASIRGSFAG